MRTDRHVRTFQVELLGLAQIVVVHRSSSTRRDRPNPQNEKADVAEHPQVFHHVGLLVNQPPGASGLLSI